MNTDKLLKAIQILVREELKTILPKLIKEVVKREVKNAETRILKESKKNIRKSKPIIAEEDADPFEKAEQALLDDRHEQQYSKNPVLNNILNETANSYGGQPGYDSTAPIETSEGTIGMNSTNVQGGNVPGSFNREEMAKKMGYGDMTASAMPSTDINGKPVDTSNPAISKIKGAMERDYSELVKRFKK